MSHEFNFKDFFFYSLNRWFYILLAVIVGIVAATGIGAYIQARERETVSYQASAIICDIETYAAAFGSSLQDSSAIAEGYRDSAKRAIDVLFSTSNPNAFLKVESNRSFVATLARASESEISALSGFLEQRLQISGTSYRATVEMKYLPQETKWDVSDVTALLDRYTSFIVSRVYENVDSLRDMKVMYDAGTLARRPIRTVDAELAFTIVQDNNLWQSSLLGGGIGLMVAGIIMLTLFLLDPKMKSMDEATGAGFAVLANATDASFERDALAAMAVNLDKMCGVCVFEPSGGDGAVAFGGALARYLHTTGYKVLLIDGIGLGGGFRDFIAGKGNMIAVLNGIDTLTFTESDDFAYLLAKKERFGELERIYDKIIFCCDARQRGAVAACSSFAGAAICVLDKTRTKTKDIYIAASELSESVSIARGVAYVGQNGK